MTIVAIRRGPKSMSWYEDNMKHALRNFRRSHVLARNPVCQLAVIRALADEQPHDIWDPEVRVLRSAIQWCVNRVIHLADEVDRPYLTAVLRGVLHGDKMEMIGRQLLHRRETIQLVWWPQALLATTVVFIRQYASTGSEATSGATRTGGSRVTSTADLRACAGPSTLENSSIRARK